MQQNVKSATTAGLLGIFLGAFGAHNWYLGEKNKGIIHIVLMSGGIVLEIVAGAILPNVMSYSMLFTMAWVLTILGSVASLAMGASAIWGLVEGIMILTQGDAGLARKGYAVANPNATGFGQPMPGQGYNPTQPGYGQPQPYNQPQPGYNPYNQAPQQGYNNQPNQPYAAPGYDATQYNQPQSYAQSTMQQAPQDASTPAQPTTSNDTEGQ